MKKILPILLAMMLLCGCSKTSDDATRFIVVEGSPTYSVCYDKHTKVMYFAGIHCFEPLYDSDGSLLLWDGEE